MDRQLALDSLDKILGVGREIVVAACESLRGEKFNEQRFTLNPFDHDRRVPEIEQALAQRRKAQLPYSQKFYDQTETVLAMIDRDNGISRANYEKHPLVFNAIARDLTESRWIGMSSASCDQSDIESAEVRDRLKSLADGAYGEAGGSSAAPLLRTYGWEGTEFSREYQDSRLLRLRVFHQGHRNSLVVSTVDLDTLVTAIREQRDTYLSEPLTVDTELPYDDMELYQLLEVFNEAARPFFRINAAVPNYGEANMFLEVANDQEAVLAKLEQDTLPNVPGVQINLQRNTLVVDGYYWIVLNAERLRAYHRSSILYEEKGFDTALSIDNLREKQNAIVISLVSTTLG